MTRALLAAARLLVGGLYLYAAATKLPDMAAFAVQVANYRLLPAALVPATAAVVVGVELTVGALLLLGRWTRGAALVAAAMMVAFIAGISQALLRGIDIECGCFGSGEAASWLTVGRDVAFLLPALAVALFGEGRPAGAASPAAATSSPRPV